MKLIKMFDVDKLYTYMYSTREEFIDQAVADDINSRLEAYFTDKAKEDRALYSEYKQYLKDNQGNIGAEGVMRITEVMMNIREQNAEIKALKELLAKNKKVVLDEKKSDENSILDIHLAVFENNNKELYQLIMSPNGFGKLKTGKTTGLSFDIDAIKLKANPKEHATHYMSAQYQMKKFFNGVSGKQGVGVFSSTSMMCAIMQGKGCKYVEYDYINGIYGNNFSIQFGKLKSDGDLSKTKTINDSQYKSKVIEAFQSASVDNEKEQILSKLNINQHTFNVINSLAMLGFDEEVICYFINQPIVERYVTEKTERESSLNKFTANKKEDVFDSIIQSVMDQYDIKEINGLYKKIGVDGLKKMMELPANQRDQEFWAMQVAQLQKFKHLNSIGQSLQGYMSAINAESKGFGKTAISSMERESKIDEFGKVEYNINEGKPISGIKGALGTLFDEEGNSTSISGFVIEYGLKELNKLTSRYFPYGSGTLQSVFDDILKISGRSAQSISSAEDFKLGVFKEIKSFMFSNFNLLGLKGDPEAVRKKLFIDEWTQINEGTIFDGTLGAIVLKRPSLASIVKAIQKTPAGKNIAIISQMDTNIDKKGGPSLIKYRASTGVNLDETELYQSFISLYIYDRPLAYEIEVEKNGLPVKEKRSISSKDLAKSLIWYSYLSGGIQEAIQFVRYIPIEILMDMGFNEKVKQQKFDSAGLKTIVDRGKVVTSNIIEQIVQHDPSMTAVKIKTPFTKGASESRANGMRVLSTKKLNDSENSPLVITSFQPYINKDNKAKSENTGEIFRDAETKEFVKYVSVKMNKKWYLYKYDSPSGSYRIIPILGTFGMSEYNYNAEIGKTVKSVLDANNLFYEENFISTQQPLDGPDINESKDSLINLYDIKSIMNSENKVLELLKKVKELQSQNKNLRDQDKMVDELLNNPSILTWAKRVNLEFVDKLDSRGNVSYGKNGEIYLKINKVIMAGSNETVSTINNTIVHEIIHAFTSQVFNSIYDRNGKLKDPSEYEHLPKSVVEDAKRLQATRRAIIYKAKQNPKFKQAIDDYNAYIGSGEVGPFKFKTDEHRLLYGLYNVKEFISEIFGNPDFRDMIDTLDTTEQTSFWRQILDALCAMLGVSSAKQLDSSFAINESINMLREINKFRRHGKSHLNEATYFDSEFEDKLETLNKLLEEKPKEQEKQKPAPSSNPVTINDLLQLVKKIKKTIENVTNQDGVVGKLRATMTDTGKLALIFTPNDTTLNKIKHEASEADLDDGSFKENVLSLYDKGGKSDFLPNIYDINESETELLKKRFGDDAVEVFNRLKPSEKESIIECLK